MIRVLTFGRYADIDFGGLERYVLELARALRNEAHFTNIVAARGGAPDIEVVGDTVHARPLGSIAGVPVCPTMPFHAHRLHRRRPFDIVHLQFPCDPAAHLATVTLPLSVKRVITWHSDIVRQKRLLRLYRPFLKRLLDGADAIIIPTPAHRSSSENLSAVGDHGQFHVVPYGFDLSHYARRPEAADAIRKRHGGRFLIFALGRHVDYKGYEYLIRALPLVPQAELVLGGRGPLTGSLEQLAGDLGVRERIEFTGRIPEADLPAYYHACDVFCLPSVEQAEAFGIVQLEAMACGKPVVCCELGNAVTWVNQDGKTGLVVPPADVAALAAALDRLRTDAGLRQMLGEQGKRRAAGEFTIEAMARGTLSVYQAVLARRA
jgi:glycosyltransferase involved in cell wall biosynthesis